jgi:hypothetical protein
MKLLTRRHLGGNRYRITAEATAGEGGIVAGDPTGTIEGMGVVHVSTLRLGPRHAWLAPQEQVLELEVETVETIGRLSDL